ncbi:MAG TPA: hypothetical protein VF192_12915 [Longimicrobiales bacterium]
MKTSRVVPLPLLLLVVACASRPSGPPPLDPVGNYEFTTSVDGQPIGGTFDIAGTPGAYTGTIRVQGMDPIPITSVTVQGQALRIAALLDGQPVAIDLSFTGDRFTGAWSAGELGGAVSGRRIR